MIATTRMKTNLIPVYLIRLLLLLIMLGASANTLAATVEVSVNWPQNANQNTVRILSGGTEVAGSRITTTSTTSYSGSITVTLGAGIYTFAMNDSGANGWGSGAYATVKVDGVTIINDVGPATKPASPITTEEYVYFSIGQTPSTLAGDVTVCSKIGAELDMQSSLNVNSLAKLRNTAYFGPSGSAAPETLGFKQIAVVSNSSLTSAGCDIFIGGGISNDLGSTEATELKTWLASGNRFVLAGCDRSVDSEICTNTLNRSLTSIANGGVTINSLLSYNPLACGGVSTIGTYGGESATVGTLAGDSTLATHNANGSAATTTDSLTAPTFIITADAEMYGSSGSTAIGAGATATTDQAKFVLNVFKFAVDEIAGRPHTCTTDYNTAPTKDYSDAPSSYGTPSHTVVAGIRLGATAPDTEAGAQPDSTATGDDTGGTDDEDAITSFPALTAGATSYSLSNIPVTNTTGSTATLYGWIDVNLNGRFDGNEVATASVANGATSANLSWSGLTGVTAGSSYVRLRLTTQALTNTNSGNLTLLDTRSDGTASNGEVEDYALSINTTPILASPGTAAPVVDLNGETQGGIIAGWSHHTPTSTLDADFTFTDPNTPDFGTLYFTGADPAVVNTSSSTAESLGTSVTRTFVGDNTIIQVGGVSLTSYTAAKGTGDYIEYRFTTSASLSTNAVIDQLGYGSHPDYGGMNPPTEPYKFTVEVSDDNFTTSDILVLDKQVSANSGSYEFLTLDVPDYSLAPSTSYTFRIYLYDDSNADGNVIWDDFAVGVTYDPTDHENTFTEGGPAVDIADVTTSVEDADDTDMSSANIVLTNAFSGDFFVINGTVTSNSSTGSVNGLNYLVTESGGQITLSLSGTASKATYATVINLIQFDSSATPINTTDRIIHVTVNDGSNNSNTAISTIHVTATPTVVSSTSCPSGTITSAVNLLSNGSFAVAPSNSYIYPAGDDGLDNTTPGFFYANASFYSQAHYRGFDVYPDDSTTGNKFGIIQDTVSWLPQVAFPGDPANNAAATPYWFYSNGNYLGVGDPSGGAAQEYLLWEEDSSNLVIGKTYSFVAYVSNVLETNGADEPIVRLRVNGTTGMPDGTVVFGPYNIPEAATANSQPLNGWQRIEYTFTASATSMKFKFTSAAKSVIGDDFGMTAMGVHECIPIATYDYGDAPVSGSAPDGSNTNAYGEAIHTIASGISLGAGDPDADTANQPTTNADGDDTDGTDDEDGVTIPTLAQGQSASIDVTVNQITASTGYLQGWIDWNGDGDFADAGEQIATDLQYSSGTGGTISIPVTVPSTAITSAPTFARFRWSTTAGLDSTTAASDGEVEDYALTINSYSTSCVAVPVTTLGNAYVNGNNEYILTEDLNDQSGFIWSNEKIDLSQPFDIQLGVYLGSNVGIDPGTGLDSGADGMSFVLQNDPRGTAAQGYPGGMMGVDGDINLSAYGYTDRAVYPSLTIEFDTFDNTFMGFTGDIAADHTAIYLNGDVTLPDAANTLLAATSVGTGGEIEDGAYHLTRYVWNPTTKNLTYYFDGAQVASVTYDLVNYFGSPYVTFGFAAATGASKNLHKACWVDAPTMVDPLKDFSDIPLTGTSYGATSHTIVSGVQLGTTNTAESSAYDTPNADGDTDDGITLPTLTLGQTSTLTATVSGSGGYLQGWIDWNGDGDFADSGEQIATNIQDNLVGDTDNTAGTIQFDVSVPASAIGGVKTYARFRWSTTLGLDSTTAASDGEVEDYAILVQEAFPGNDNTGLYCPAVTTDTPYTDYRIAWTYNSPINTLLPDHIGGGWPNGQFDQTVIASAPAQVIGSGMSYTFDGDKQTVIHLSGVDQSDATNAFGFGDYIEYQFTTDAAMNPAQLFNGFAFASHSFTQSYKIDILFSEDNFATATTLLSNYTVSPASGAYQWIDGATNQPLYLKPNTTYKFRILFYGATDTNAVYWDDFHVSMGLCQDYSDAPNTNYGAASHDQPRITTHYLGSAKADAESATRDGGDAGVGADGDDTAGSTPDDEDGVDIANVTLTQGQNTTITATVNGAGGYLQAWFDWNGDGDFADSGEQVATDVQDSNSDGIIPLSVTPPTNAFAGTTFARFRWSTTMGLDAASSANDGEVEDYALTVFPQPAFSCSTDFYLTAGDPATMLTLDVSTTPVTESLFIPDTNIPYNRINATAYNTADNYIYTLQRTTPFNMMRIGSDGSVITLGTVTGINAASVIVAGDFDGATGKYIVKTNNPFDLYEVDINTLTAASLGVNIGDVADIAWNPADGLFYGVAATGGVISIDPNTGYTVTTVAPHPAGSGTVGATFFDSTGTFYALDNNTQAFYAIDLATGNATQLGSGIGATDDNDGAHCPNAAAIPLGIISGKVYQDSNGSNSFDSGSESGIGSITVNLYRDNGTPGNTADDILVATRVTAADGSYTFQNVNAGAGITYRVEVDTTDSDLPSGAQIGTTNPVEGVVVTDGGTTTVDFGFDLSDYGDAPASYGDASHATSTGSTVYLGTIAGDIDTTSQNSANGSTDGSGDDNDGTDDEDGVANFPVLANGAVDYSLNVVANNTSGNTANLIGWIDFNRNGLFDSGEAASASIASGASNKVVALTWNSLPGDIQPGSTYLRLRLTTDSSITTSTPAGTADDGEVEDYSLVIGDSGYTVTGTVYHDTNVDGNNAAEDGIQDVTVVLYDTAGGTCRSTKTGADGSYQFTGVQPAAADNYVVYEAADEDHQSPAACPPVATDPNGYVSSTANTQTITVSMANVSGVDFGDVKIPTFTLDNTQVILPNTTVAYPHVFRSATDGSVTFSLTDSADPSSLTWGTGLYLDNNCDAALDAGDTAITGSITVSAGDKLCILTKVLAPANATAGAAHTLDVTSSFTYGDGTLITVGAEQTRTDITSTSSGTSTDPVGGEGKLSLVKSVWNATRGTTVGDNDGSVALPGEILRYTIRYENIGNGQLDELVVHDSVPAFTQLGGTGLVCGTTPSELSACTPTEAGGSLDWAFTGQLLPGSSGDVYYEVVVE